MKVLSCDPVYMHARETAYVFDCTHAGSPTYYEISVEAPDSFSIGSKNTIHCSVSPKPVQPVTYIWRETSDGVSISHTSALSSNAIVSIQSFAPKYGHYYCTVRQDGITLGTGVIKLKINSEKQIPQANYVVVT